MKIRNPDIPTMSGHLGSPASRHIGRHGMDQKSFAARFRKEVDQICAGAAVGKVGSVSFSLGCTGLGESKIVLQD